MEPEPDLTAHKTITSDALIKFPKYSTRKPTVSERLPDDTMCGLEESLTRKLYKQSRLRENVFSLANV